MHPCRLIEAIGIGAIIIGMRAYVGNEWPRACVAGRPLSLTAAFAAALANSIALFTAAQSPGASTPLNITFRTPVAIWPEGGRDCGNEVGLNQGR